MRLTRFSNLVTQNPDIVSTIHGMCVAVACLVFFTAREPLFESVLAGANTCARKGLCLFNIVNGNQQVRHTSHCATQDLFSV